MANLPLYTKIDSPSYVPVQAKEQFASVPVEEGHVLLFTEDGKSITAKNADGSFSSVGGGGGGTDTSDATATAADILSGKTAYGKDGKLTGTIKTVTPVQGDGVVTIEKGYLAEAVSIEQGGGGGSDVPFPADYIFHEPLGSAPTTAGVTLHGSPAFTTLWGIPCVNLTTKGQGISWNGGMIDDADFASPHTVAVAFYGRNTNDGYLYYRYFKDTSSNSGTRAVIRPRVSTRDSVNYVALEYGGNAANNYTKNVLVNDKWLTFVVTVDGDNARLYVNGQMFSITATREFNAGSAEDLRKYVIGGLMPNGNGTIEQLCVGYYADLRFYDRALSAAEVLKLHESLQPVVPFAEGKFTVTGDEWVDGVYYAEPGTKGAGRRWMQEWDGESEERMGIMFDGTFWIICTFLAMYEETEDGDYVMTGEWEPGYEAYYDPSRQFDENFENLVGEPLGVGVAAPDMAGTWGSAGDPTEGQVTVTYAPYTPQQ